MKQPTFSRSKIAAGIIAATLTGSLSAAMLEEVIVTATKRVESMQDVPISVAAVSAKKMSDAGIVDLESLSAYVPNFTVNETGISTTVTIRGISSGINPGFEQSVGIYNDGIFYGRDQLARTPMMDLERVEVLRGPQGILFGKNSIAGAVSQISAKPTEEFEGSITGLYEPDAEEKDLRLVVSGPFSDNVAGRLAILVREQDGYMTNDVSNTPAQQEEESFIRASLKWDITDSVQANLKLSHAEFDTVGRNIEVYQSVKRAAPGGVDHLTSLNGIMAYLDSVSGDTIYGGYRVEGDLNHVRGAQPESNSSSVDNATLTFEWDLDAFTITSITGLVEYDWAGVCDCDFSGANIFTADQAEDYKQFSQELRFTSPGGETVDYIGGLFFQTNELSYSDIIQLPDSPQSILNAALTPSLGAGLASLTLGSSTRRDFTQDGDLWAAFAQFTWNISDTLRLTAGGRYTSEKKDATRSQINYSVDGVAQDPEEGMANSYNLLFGLFNIESYDGLVGDDSETAFTPVITGQWDATDDMMVYATWTKGFKSGGFDTRSNAHPDVDVKNAFNVQSGQDLVGSWQFEPEEANSFELGAKMSIGPAAELNVALYRTEYTDLQVSQFDGVLGFNVTNAGEATIQGIELDGRWAATDNLTLAGSVAYLDFEYDSFPNSQCAFDQASDYAPGEEYAGLCDATGKRKEYTPETRALISADWNQPIGESLEIRAGLDLNYVSKYLYAATLDERTQQDAHTLVGARISLGNQQGTWEVALIGRNLTDETVLNFGGNTPLAGTLTGGTGNSYYAFTSRPRNIALQATYRF
ncbi:MAG: TonB-dependent receptor [Pseudomonadales bacterium]